MKKEFCDNEKCEKEIGCQDVKYHVQINRKGPSREYDSWTCDVIFCSSKCMYQYLKDNMKNSPGVKDWTK